MRPRTSPSVLLRLSLFALLAAAAGCGGGRSDDLDVTPDDVDEAAEATITEAEYAAFDAPQDSVLTPEQVEAYLKTSLLQFDLVRKNSERLHVRVREMEKRAEKGGAMAGLRNLMDAGRTMAEAGDLIGGSHVRSARTLGYNPAELEWVRERMSQVAIHLAMLPMQESAREGAREMRQQVEALREQLATSPEAAGFTEADLDRMLATADQAEAHREGWQASPSLEASVAVLRRTRPAVTDAMWSAIGVTGGASGLLAWSGLSDPDDPEAQEKLDEYRQLFTDALANQVTPGMENPGS